MSTDTSDEQHTRDLLQQAPEFEVGLDVVMNRGTRYRRRRMVMAVVGAAAAITIGSVGVSQTMGLLSDSPGIRSVAPIVAPARPENTTTSHPTEDPVSTTAPLGENSATPPGLQIGILEEFAASNGLSVAEAGFGDSGTYDAVLAARTDARYYITISTNGSSTGIDDLLDNREATQVRIGGHDAWEQTTNGSTSYLMIRSDGQPSIYAAEEDGDAIFLRGTLMPWLIEQSEE